MTFPQALTNWIDSNYVIDDTPQGFVTYDLHSWNGRLISLIDLPSQLVNSAGIAVSKTLLVALKISQSTLHLLKGIIFLPPVCVGTFIWNPITAAKWQGHTVEAFVNSGQRLSEGLFTLIFEIPAYLFFRFVKVQADVLGIFLPEIGRLGRNWGKQEPQADTPIAPAAPARSLLNLSPTDTHFTHTHRNSIGGPGCSSSPD